MWYSKLDAPSDFPFVIFHFSFSISDLPYRIIWTERLLHSDD